MRTTEQLIEDTAPFPADLIEQVPGGANRPSLDYVPWNHYAQRILKVHGGHRYEVTNVVGIPVEGYDYNGEAKTVVQWAVTVQLTLGPDETYGGVGFGDDPLSAESNAYKRACAHAGIGLHLYGDYWLHGSLVRATTLPAEDPAGADTGDGDSGPHGDPDVAIGGTEAYAADEPNADGRIEHSFEDIGES